MTARLACLNSQLMSLFTAGAPSWDLCRDSANCLAEAMSNWHPVFRSHLRGSTDSCSIAVLTASSTHDCETLPPNAVSYMNAKVPRVLSTDWPDQSLTKVSWSKGCAPSLKAPLRTINFTIGRSFLYMAMERAFLVHGSPFLQSHTRLGRSFFLLRSVRFPLTASNKIWLQGRSASQNSYELWCVATRLSANTDLMKLGASTRQGSNCMILRGNRWATCVHMLTV